jgi:hypothetical protein
MGTVGVRGTERVRRAPVIISWSKRTNSATICSDSRHCVTIGDYGREREPLTGPGRCSITEIAKKISDNLTPLAKKAEWGLGDSRIEFSD